MNAAAARRFSVAPMLDWTDRHCRAFHRHLTRRALLYTEMVTTGAILHGPRDRLLGFSPQEHPIAVQLGGSDPADLAECARLAAEAGYDEINLNVGCPSDRVQNGRFGACLMREPDLVAACVAAMKRAVSVPVTVKCRIGVDEQDPAEALPALAGKVVAAGADALIVHARKAWLKGLSPRENREVPPLDHDLVFALKRAMPEVTVVINGGIGSLAEAEALLAPRDGVALDGVMLGRAAYQSPALLLGVDAAIFGEPPDERTPLTALAEVRPYIAARLGEGVPLHAMTRHVLGLFQAVPGARQFRRHLSEQAVRPGAGLDVFDAGVDIIERAAARRAA